MTLTDEIREELREGLRRGVKYEQIRAKFDRDKGPFYNALGTVFADIGTEIESLASERDKIAGQVEKAKSEFEKIDNENKARERRATELDGRVSELERAEKSAQQRIEKLNRGLGAKTKLLEKAEKIEGLGFTVKKLEKLGEKIVGISAARGIGPTKATETFVRDLDSYSDKVGFQVELERQKTSVATEKSEVARWKAEKKKLELQYANRKAIVDELESLMRQGVRENDILTWSRILASAGKTPDGFAEDLENYRKIKLILSAQVGEVQNLDRKLGGLKSQVVALEKRKVEVESSIKALADSGVKEIERVRDRAERELNTLMEQTKRLGEVKAETGKLEQELEVARYFTIKDPVAIKLFPKGAIAFLLSKVVLWCELWGINPEVKVPEGLSRKYLGISSWAEVGLADLLRWGYTGLLGVKVEK